MFCCAPAAEARSVIEQVEAAVAAKAKAEEAVAALRQAHKAELDAEKAHYEGLLQRARAAQVQHLHWHLMLPLPSRNTLAAFCSSCRTPPSTCMMTGQQNACDGLHSATPQNLLIIAWEMSPGRACKYTGLHRK